MRKDTTLLSEAAVFIAGVLAAKLMAGPRKGTEVVLPAESEGDATVAELRRQIAELERRLAGHESATAKRLGQVETRLAEMPTTAQIVGAMEQLLSKTMSSLDERLTAQAQTIEVLKTTVSQTDGLLVRVLESLDSLQTFAEAEPAGEALRAAV